MQKGGVNIKCEKCGAENDASSLFCENCGSPIRSLANWETDEDNNATVKEEKAGQTAVVKPEKNSTKKVILIVSAAVLGLILVIGGVLGFLNFQKVNAINSGIKNGESLLADTNYTEALTVFDDVLKIDSNNADAIFGKAKAYTGLSNFVMAKTFYEDALLKEKNKEKQKQIYDAYINSEIMAKVMENDLFTLLDRAAAATGEKKYSNQKSDYAVKVPSFKLNPGTYQGTQSLEIVKGDINDKVYYTTDGSQPAVGSIEYTDPVLLQKGEHIIRAIEVGSSGFSSKTIEGKYSIVDVPTTTGGTVSGGGTSDAADYYNFSLVASSTLPNMSGISYYVGNVMDGNDNTAWVEGVAGDGVGEHIQCVYNGTGPLTIHGFAIKTGYVKSSTTFAENGSVRGLAVYVNTNPIANAMLERIRDEQTVSISPTTINPGDSLVFMIDSVVPGPSDGEHDTAISEIRLF